MKRIISIFFALVLCISLQTPISAGGNTGLINNMYYLRPEGFRTLSENKEGALYFDGYKEIYISCISGIKEVLGFNNNTKSIKEVKEKNIKTFLENIINDEKLEDVSGIKNGKTEIISKKGQFVKNAMNTNMYVYDVKFTVKASGYEEYKGDYRAILLLNQAKIYLIEYGKRQIDNENKESIKAFENSILFEEKDYTNVIRIIVNDNFVNPDSDPVIINDRTLVPIRAVAEELGYKVEWEAAERKVIIKNGFKSLHFVIDSNIMLKGMGNDLIKEEIEVPAQIISDRTYLPLRAVGEALGCTVDWDAENRTVIINE